MKYLFTILLLQLSVPLFSQSGNNGKSRVSPLASYNTIWNNPKYSNCNTAAGASFLSSDEKDVIYILNLIRTYPVLFTETVLLKYPAESGNGYLAEDSFYFISLVNTLKKTASLPLLYPDEKCFISAKCHAFSSGLTGYVGHDRTTKDCKTKKNYYGECCEYGHNDPLDIVLSLLIDEGIPSLGHRGLFLSGFSKIAVSIQPHLKYGTNTVIDFSY